MTLGDDLRVMATQADSLGSQNTQLLAQNSSLADTVAAQQTKIDQLNVQIADLQAQLDAQQPAPTPTPTPTPPPPATTGTFFGSCPTSSGGGVAAVRTKYGPKASARIFLGDLTARPSIPSGAAPVWVSFKPSDVPGLLAGRYDANLKAICDLLRAKDAITFHHERDNDGIDGTAAVTEWKNENNYLYDFVKGYKPSVLTGPIFTGGLMASYTADSRRQQWCRGLKGDLFGVDCDGVHITTSEPNYSRINYKDEIDNCLRYMADPSNSGFKSVGVAEFMTARSVPPDDNNGTMRAAWLDTNSAYMVSKGCRFILLFDTSVNGRPGNELANPSAELTLWRSRVASNPV